jgi:hypothetical protein
MSRQLPKKAKSLVHELGIQIRSRLVGDYQVNVSREHSGYRDALTLPSRKAVHIPSFEATHPDLGKSLLDPRVSLPFGDARIAQILVDYLPSSLAREKREVLWDQSYSPDLSLALRVPSERSPVTTHDFDAALVRFPQCSGKNFDQSALTGSARTGESRKTSSGKDIESRYAEDVLLLPGVTKPESSNSNQRGGRDLVGHVSALSQ